MTIHDWLLWLFAALLGLGLVLIPAHRSSPHDYYAPECCNDRDCRVIEDSRVKITEDGYLVDGKWLFKYSETKAAPENRYSLCQLNPELRPLCFYAPPRSA